MTASSDDRAANTAPNSPIVQGIITRFYGPTNTLGSRYSARAQAGIVWSPADHALNPDQNHYKVAKALADRFGWLEGAELAQGGHPDGNGCVFVVVVKRS